MYLGENFKKIVISEKHHMTIRKYDVISGTYCGIIRKYCTEKNNTLLKVIFTFAQNHIYCNMTEYCYCEKILLLREKYNMKNNDVMLLREEQVIMRKWQMVHSVHGLKHNKILMSLKWDWDYNALLSWENIMLIWEKSIVLLGVSQYYKKTLCH